MKHLTASRIGVLLAALLGVTVSASVVSAQMSAPVTLSIPAGQMVEIGLDTQVNQPVFSWILTRDREFVTAQRNPFFQLRQSATGRYTLDVSIQDQEHQRSEQQTFTIEITDPVPTTRMTPPSTPEMTIMPIISISPMPTSSNVIALPVAGGTATIDMSQSIGSITRYGVDLDSNRDTDGDGVFDNDIDNVGTLSERSGSPIIYLFKPSVQNRNITVNLSSTGGLPARQQYGLLFTPDAVVSPTPGTVGSRIPVSIEQNGMTIHPSIMLDSTIADPSLILVEWDFGDRNKSLLERPAHTYASPGSYVVRVFVRNISNGETLLSGENQIVVNEDVTPGDNGGSTSSEPGTDEPSKSDSNLGSIMAILGGIFLILGFAIGAFLVIKSIKNRATGKIQKKFEEMEGKIFNEKKDANVVDVTPQPQDEHLTLRREVPEEVEPEPEPQPAVEETPIPEPIPEEVIDRDAARTEFKPQENLEVPSRDAGPVPTWLKGDNGVSDVTVEPVVPEPAPAPTPEPTPPAPVPEPAPAPVIEAPTPAAESPVPAPAVPTTTDTKTPEQLAVEERERERKRRKRQRYRQNKKIREQGTADAATAEPTTDETEAPIEDAVPSNEPIATIRIDSLNQGDVNGTSKTN